MILEIDTFCCRHNSDRGIILVKFKFCILKQYILEYNVAPCLFSLPHWQSDCYLTKLTSLPSGWISAFLFVHYLAFSLTPSCLWICSLLWRSHRTWVFFFENLHATLKVSFSMYLHTFHIWCRSSFHSL